MNFLKKFPLQILVFSIIFLIISTNLVEVLAWSNGGYSEDPLNPDYGTHDWIAEHALDCLPENEKQFITNNLISYLYGTELPDNSNPEDGIGDTTKHHVYFNSAESVTDDSAAVRAQEEYNKALNYLELNEFEKALKTAGIMTHYMADMAVFGHVMGASTEWGSEDHHSDYESYVNTRTNSYNDEFNAYLLFDGSLDEITAYEATLDLAYDATFDVDGDLSCVWMDENYDWSNSAFFNRCTESINLAVNLVADVLHTLIRTVAKIEPESAYLVVRGSDSGIYYRSYKTGEDTWGNWIALPGSTCDTPAAAMYDDKLYIVVRGMDGASLWFGSADLSDDSFSGWSYLSGATPSKPTLVCWENGERLVLVARGTDNRLYYRFYSRISDTWGNWILVPTGTTCDSPAATIDGDYLHLVVRGMDDGLYHQKVYLSTFDIIYFGWTCIGGTTPSAPTLASNCRTEGDDHLFYLIVRGSDDGIYLRSYDGGWSTWASLPGATIDAVGACIQPSKPDPDATLHVVVKGMTGGLYHGKFDLNSESFLGWTWISGETPSPPTLANSKPTTEKPTKIYGLNFGPFTEIGQNPETGTIIDEEQIRRLIETIQSYTEWIRTYGCSNGLEVAGRVAHELGLKIAVGAWLSNDLEANENEIDKLLTMALAGEADMLIVGSEVLQRGDLTETQLIEYINMVKSIVPELPVATADVYSQLLAHPAVIAAGDIVLPNYYPYWEGVNVVNAVFFINSLHNQMIEAAAGKPVIVSESGWPSDGNQIGEAVASAENAAYFFLNFESWAKAENVSTFYFEAFDEPWKVINEGPQGAHWGIWDGDGVLKPGMKTVFDGTTIPDNWSGNIISGGPGDPEIEFTYVPPYGSFDNLQGQVWHVKPVDHRVVIYIKVDSVWWIKPYSLTPLTIIQTHGSWVCDITTGGIDETATEIAAYLISADYEPTNQPSIELEQASLSKCQVTRTPNT